MSKDNLSGDLINITTSHSNPRQVEYSLDKMEASISIEEDGYYKIVIADQVIHTKVTERLLNDLYGFGILNDADADDLKKEKLEAYLIHAAKQFIVQGLHKHKQDARGKIDVPGIEDEF
jgi:hypothetical protein